MTCPARRSCIIKRLKLISSYNKAIEAHNNLLTTYPNLLSPASDFGLLPSFEGTCKERDRCLYISERPDTGGRKGVVPEGGDRKKPEITARAPAIYLVASVFGS